MSSNIHQGLVSYKCILIVLQGTQSQHQVKASNSTTCQIYQGQQQNQSYCHTSIILISGINNSIKLPYNKTNVLPFYMRSENPSCLNYNMFPKYQEYQYTSHINYTFFHNHIPSIHEDDVPFIPQGLPFHPISQLKQYTIHILKHWYSFVL